MSRYTKRTVTIEDCLVISMQDLKRLGYLKPSLFIHRHISQYYQGNEIGSYTAIISTLAENSYIQLSYTLHKSNGTTKDISYKVELVVQASNIGKGIRYYFLCPHRRKKCLKLYKPPLEDYFLHRDSFPYLFYKSQIKSKKERTLDKCLFGLSSGA